MSRNIELESAIKYTISNPTRYNGFLRVAANNFRLSTANQLKHTAYAELKELLTEEEYDSARSSVLTAFYTDPQIIRGMYEVLERMGFDGGNEKS